MDYAIVDIDVLHCANDILLAILAVLILGVLKRGVSEGGNIRQAKRKMLQSSRCGSYSNNNSMIAHKQPLFPSLLNDMHQSGLGWQLRLVCLVRKFIAFLAENVAVKQALAICPMTVV